MGTFLGPAPTITPDEITEEMLSKYQCIYIEGYLLVNEPLVRSTMEKAKKLGFESSAGFVELQYRECF